MSISAEVQSPWRNESQNEHPNPCHVAVHLQAHPSSLSRKLACNPELPREAPVLNGRRFRILGPKHVQHAVRLVLFGQTPACTASLPMKACNSFVQTLVR